jgi:hypothetical protein
MFPFICTYINPKFIIFHIKRTLEWLSFTKDYIYIFSQEFSQRHNCRVTVLGKAMSQSVNIMRQRGILPDATLTYSIVCLAYCNNFLLKKYPACTVCDTGIGFKKRPMYCSINNKYKQFIFPLKTT